MADKPILFSAPMVRALLEGRKTMTRRVLKPQPDVMNGSHPLYDCFGSYCNGVKWYKIKLEVGDRLWVREAMKFDADDFCCWAADMHRIPEIPAEYKLTRSSMPSMFMPRWASRITLEVTGVKVEQLQDISEDDAKTEGVEMQFRTAVAQTIGPSSYRIPNGYRGGFANIWSLINGNGSWESNPWVAAYSFKVIKPEVK